MSYLLFSRLRDHCGRRSKQIIRLLDPEVVNEYKEIVFQIQLGTCTYKFIAVETTRQDLH